MRELRAQVARAAPRPPGRPRRIVAAVLVVVTSIVFTVAVVGVWTRRNALNTDKWVETVGPIAEDPAVQQALGNWMTTELMGAIDPEAYFESVLPERGQALAAPLTSALQGFVNNEVDAFLASDTFERLWVEVNRRAHARVVDVLEGDTGNLQIEDGETVLNLVPVLNGVLAQIGEASPEIFGKAVEDSMGHGRFLGFYLVCGVVAAGAQYLQDPASALPMVGASGAVAGTLGAYLLLHPNARIWTVVVFGYFVRTVPVPAMVVLGFWVVLQFVNSIFTFARGGAGDVAFLAHVGGFLAGLALIGVFRRSPVPRRRRWA